MSDEVKYYIRLASLVSFVLVNITIYAYIQYHNCILFDAKEFTFSINTQNKNYCAGTSIRHVERTICETNCGSTVEVQEVAHPFGCCQDGTATTIVTLLNIIFGILGKLTQFEILIKITIFLGVLRVIIKPQILISITEGNLPKILAIIFVFSTIAWLSTTKLITERVLIATTGMVLAGLIGIYVCSKNEKKEHNISRFSITLQLMFLTFVLLLTTWLWNEQILGADELALVLGSAVGYVVGMGTCFNSRKTITPEIDAQNE